jgi:ATP-binding cassette subfamily B protein
VVGVSEEDAPDQQAPLRLTRGIELTDISFTYPGTEAAVLQDVNLEIPAGTTVAVVGENGAGKTSLVKLLCALYRPSGGRISVDGVDLGRIPERQWRDRIAAGFQDFVRFELIAREAVGVGDLPRIASDDAVLGAMDRAQARGLVDQLEQGLDTQLGIGHAKGAELSGGQWQKLALGRAFMREEPLLLVLDEPTAALDAQAEHVLFERYAEQARAAARRTGAITVLVSHRFSTVRTADIIVVLAEGRVAQVGDHATLIQEGGLYAELYGIQAEAYR